MADATQKNPHAVALGKRGGKARVKSMTPEQLSEAGRAAVNKRWAEKRKASTLPLSSSPKHQKRRKKTQ